VHGGGGAEKDRTGGHAYWFGDVQRGTLRGGTGSVL
jgi:hypothetical protein